MPPDVAHMPGFLPPGVCSLYPTPKVHLQARWVVLWMGFFRPGWSRGGGNGALKAMWWCRIWRPNGALAPLPSSETFLPKPPLLNSPYAASLLAFPFRSKYSLHPTLPVELEACRMVQRSRAVAGARAMMQTCRFLSFLREIPFLMAQTPLRIPAFSS